MHRGQKRLPEPPHVDPGLFGVYVHVPFCLTRCHYCDFVTYTGMEGLRRPYAAALLDEAEMAAAALGPEPPAVTSVFVGGGTPTLLPPEDLGRLLARLRELLPFAPGAEVTVEANPETVDPAWPRGWPRPGSPGCRWAPRASTTGSWPRSAGSTTPPGSAAAVAALRAAGVPALNLDLIYGGPGEDAGSWAATLEAAIALAPEHLSAYALTIEPATKFGRLVAAGRMAEPDEDDLADRYDTACAPLAAAGYRHYEVSNWATAARREPRRPGSRPRQPAQPHLLAAGAVPRPGRRGARVRRGHAALERRRGARLPGGGAGRPAADGRARSGSTPGRPGSRRWPCGCGPPTGSTRARPAPSASTPTGRRPPSCDGPACWPPGPGCGSPSRACSCTARWSPGSGLSTRTTLTATLPNMDRLGREGRPWTSTNAKRGCCARWCTSSSTPRSRSGPRA